MQAGAHEISSAADDLSRRTERQAASLEQTAAALDQITATVRRTAENAQAADSVVGQGRSQAEVGATVVRRAVAAMGEIEHSSGQINQIIGVIDEIAFQTNLLALNAGVEAARAWATSASPSNATPDRRAIPSCATIAGTASAARCTRSRRSCISAGQEQASPCAKA